MYLNYLLVRSCLSKFKINVSLFHFRGVYSKPLVFHIINEQTISYLHKSARREQEKNTPPPLTTFFQNEIRIIWSSFFPYV